MNNRWVAFPFIRSVRWLVVAATVLALAPATGRAQVNADSIKRVLQTGALHADRRIELLNQLSHYYIEDSTNQSLIYANEAYLIALKEKNIPQEIRSLLYLAEGYLYNDDYDQALQYTYTAMDLCNEVDDKTFTADCYTRLGWIFYDTENADQALANHKAAQALYRALKDTHKDAVALNAIGLCFLSKGDHDSAKIYFERSLALSTPNQWKNTMAAAYNNIGICENSGGNFVSALSYFDRAFQIKSDMESPLTQAETLTQSAYSHLMLNKFATADSCLTLSRRWIERSTSNERKEKLLDNLNISMMLHAAQGNYKKAYEDLKTYTNIRSGLISYGKTQAIASMPLKREVRQKENELRTIDAQKQLRSFQRNFLAILVVLLVIIGMMWYSRIRLRHQRDKEMEAMKQQLMQKALNEVVSEKQALDQKLEFKSGELKNYALFIAQRNDLMRDFIGQIDALHLEGELKSDTAGKLKAVLQKMTHDLYHSKDTQEFNLSVEDVHKDFFYNLLSRYPRLTENERRICAQIRLNLSIKDIASLNNISIKSAEMARYRLRKQLGLQHHENLYEFLQQF